MTGGAGFLAATFCRATRHAWAASIEYTGMPNFLFFVIVAGESIKARPMAACDGVFTPNCSPFTIYKTSALAISRGSNYPWAADLWKYLDRGGRPALSKLTTLTLWHRSAHRRIKSAVELSWKLFVKCFLCNAEEVKTPLVLDLLHEDQDRL